jgi:prepilin-type N-terminal cleavage/methylation domain-containing protein/prepilin-type processing-associated H-X9-DG protein
MARLAHEKPSGHPRAGPPAAIGRSGFTLVEMLTVMAIITVLVAILLPALNAARESARSTACRNSLRELGVGLQGHANRFNGPFCSGAFDWLRDGAVTEVGWVADLVQANIPVGSLLCPGNPAFTSETYNDLMMADTASFDACVDRLGRPEGVAPDGSPLVNPCRRIAGAYAGGSPLSPGSPARRKVIEEEILDLGYNTNYTASWFLVRSAVQLDKDGNLLVKAGCPTGALERSSTGGPLHAAKTETGHKPANFIPLLACGSGGESLKQEIGNFPAVTPTARAMTGGPVLSPSMQVPTFAEGTPRATWWKKWSEETLQDYRAFGPVHRGGVCNILFADGSVRPYVDANRDDRLNNGFQPDPANGFLDEAVELPDSSISSHWSLRK